MDSDDQNRLVYLSGDDWIIYQDEVDQELEQGLGSIEARYIEGLKALVEALKRIKRIYHHDRNEAIGSFLLRRYLEEQGLDRDTGA